MEISRRDFLKLAAAAAAALGIGADQLLRLEEALAAGTSPPVIWLQGASCTGCSISLLNSTSPTIDDVLLNTVSMKYHPTLSAAQGDKVITSLLEAADANAGGYVLCVEGGIPTAASGHYCTIGRRNGAEWTIEQAVRELGPKAKRVVAVGTCASFGGVVKPSAYTGVRTVKDVLGKVTPSVVNLPGCPAHPNAVIGTLVSILTGSTLQLDSAGRPTAYYTNSVHQKCPRRGTPGATQLGAFGCYKNFGCKGPQTQINCPSHKWNGGVNWCVESGMACIGCASSSFPATPLVKA